MLHPQEKWAKVQLKFYYNQLGSWLELACTLTCCHFKYHQRSNHAQLLMTKRQRPRINISRGNNNCMLRHVPWHNYFLEIQCCKPGRSKSNNTMHKTMFWEMMLLKTTINSYSIYKGIKKDAIYKNATVTFWVDVRNLMK